MKKILITIFILVKISITFCQEKEKSISYYFLQAHPFDDIPEMFPAILYQYNNGTKKLDTIYHVSTKEEEIQAINQYPKYKKLCIYKDGYWFEPTKRRLTIIDYSRDVVINEIAFDTLNSNLANIGDLYAFNNGKKGFFVDIQFLGKIDNVFKILNIGVNLSDLNIETFEAENFKQVYLTGFSHSVLSIMSIISAYVEKGESKLRIAETKNPDERPIFPIEIPKEIWYAKEKQRVGMSINTDRVYVLMRRSDSLKQRYGNMILLDKENDNWRIKRNISPPHRAFDFWLAGHYIEHLNRKTDEFKISPGKEHRRQNHDAPSGWNFDGRAKMKYMYHSGRLYLYHVQTEAYIEWDTKQGDSEVLLVEDDIVYYRVSDAIYKCAIIDEKKLGEPELIIQEDKVADIHWMFIAVE